MINNGENSNNKGGFLDKTLRKLRGVWRGIAGIGYDAEAASLRPNLPEGDVERLREQMRACLERRGGEVSARARAAALGHAYLALDPVGRERFLHVLANDFDTDPQAVDAAIESLQVTGNREARRKAADDLRKALEPPRIHLLTQFNALPEGVKFLVDLRADLLRLAKADPALRGLERDLKTLLANWFDIGFLELRRITWDSATGALLEKLIAYEAVHTIESWDDLKNRLDSDHRCFAYFHPCMPDEPLIFVEVALTNGLADNVQDLLDENSPVQDPESADTAIFYSISNAQKGLAGISFGNHLIKRVAASLADEIKSLRNFATLSPVPGFLSWLEAALDGECVLLAGEIEPISGSGGTPETTNETLRNILSRPGWHEDEALAKALRAPLMRLCARFLVGEKGDGGRALDPVAHFHFSNGARMERLNWMGDGSPKGLRQSAGIMINYLYKLGEIDDNHEAYTSNGQVAASASIVGLRKG